MWYQPAAGRWYVRVHGAAAFSDVSLQATYAGSGRLFPTDRVTGLSGAAGSRRYFFVNVRPKARKLVFRTGVRNARVALYARLYALPAPFADACQRGPQTRQLGKCTVRNPTPGYWYLALYGVTDYSSLLLKSYVL